MAQLELLRKRRRVPLNGEFADGITVRISTTVRQVDDYNDKMSKENAKLHRTYQINAVDESHQNVLISRDYGRKPPKDSIPKDVNNSGLRSSTKIGIECRVFLRRNSAVSEGLVNGVMESNILGILYEHEERPVGRCIPCSSEAALPRITTTAVCRTHAFSANITYNVSTDIIYNGEITGAACSYCYARCNQRTLMRQLLNSPTPFLQHSRKDADV
ncbi:hypothetical protein EVAR_20804_1 [Eumeta japonica]|uniref:Uncharacterized protein n=1 Tax=Eumeta variegata TaxID=151549 RepID=A0A4C1UEC1_EUMVA|nr:hypothetical protein EVAR_20804_1 [Eumeta japonica]